MAHGIMLMFILLGLLFSALDIQASGPVTITVPDDYPTIQEAVEIANEGDTVFVKSGTYSGSIGIGKAISLIGENKETCVIESGFISLNADNVTVSGFTIRNGFWGVRVESNYNRIIGNIFANNSADTIYLADVHDNLVAENEVTRNNVTWGSIYLYSSFKNTIRENVVYSNRFCGICLFRSGGNNLTGNTIFHHNPGTGIILLDSNNNLLRNNNMTGNEHNFGVVDGYFQDIDASNLVDGKPVIYLVNKSDITIRADAGYVAAVNSDNITAQGLTLRNNRQGIIFYNTNNSTIRGNTIGNNWEGIILINTSNTTVFHNNIVFNTYQVQPHDSRFFWNDEYPSGGNYWSDYTGADLFKGPYQNETGSDGIGDTPYRIYGWRVLDEYPLMKPWFPRILIGDIDGDGTVNIVDITIAAKAFGSTPGYPNWNEEADLDKNGIINIVDIALAAKDYGKSV